MRHDTSAPLRTLAATATVADRRVRSASVSASSTSGAVTVVRNFDGIGLGLNVEGGGAFSPTDVNSAVGATQVVEIVNQEFAVFSKTGALLFGPAPNRTLWAGFGDPCQLSNNGGDPVVRYDTLANRWVVLAHVQGFPGNFMCVAVSAGPDATGAYHRYQFTYPVFPDYPKLGVWPDGYYLSVNGSRPCVLDRARMLVGAPATQQCVTPDLFNITLLLQSDLDGLTPPPAGAPNLYFSTTYFPWTQLLYWKFHVDWANPANTRFDGPGSLTVPTYRSVACTPTFRSCVPQPSPGVKLDAFQEWLMYRVAYRNLGTHQALVATHTVPDLGTGLFGARWYDLRLDAAGNPFVHQQGDVRSGPDDAMQTNRWFTAAAMDRAGNIALGYSASSALFKPELRVIGRQAADPLGQMAPANEVTVAASTGVQYDPNGPPSANTSRWADYTSMSVDPIDECTFWSSGQYIGADGLGGAKTRMTAFRINGCTTPPTTFSVANSFSFEGEPVATGTFLTLFTNRHVTDETQNFAYPWPAATPGGLTVRSAICPIGQNLRILYVGPTGTGGTQINVYHPNDYLGGANAEPFGTCPASGTSAFIVHPKPGFGPDVVRPVVLTQARPALVATGSEPAGYHLNANTGATTAFAVCNVDTAGTACPVSTAGQQNFLILTTSGLERFGCADPATPCTPPLSGLAFQLAPVAGGQVGAFATQDLTYFGWAGYLGVEQANVRIAAGTPPGEKRLRATVPWYLTGSNQQLTVRLGAPN